MGKGATASQHQQQNLEVGRNGSDGRCDRGKREHEFRPVNGASMPAQRPKEKIAGGNKPAGERRSEQEQEARRCEMIQSKIRSGYERESCTGTKECVLTQGRDKATSAQVQLHCIANQTQPAYRTRRGAQC